MTLTPMFLCFLLRESSEGREVLLGRKQLGFGTGNIIGLGGHVEPGEDASAAAIRETWEESGLLVKEHDLRHAGTVIFRFSAKPEWDQSVDVFVSDVWSGDIVPSDEIAPEWFPADTLPYARMWDDPRYWIPGVIAGHHVMATFESASDCRTIAHADVQTTPR